MLATPPPGSGWLAPVLAGRAPQPEGSGLARGAPGWDPALCNALAPRGGEVTAE